MLKGKTAIVTGGSRGIRCNAIAPGVILCEILAQSACILLKGKMTDGKLPVYTGLNNVKFRSPVKPGAGTSGRSIRSISPRAP